MLTFKKGDISKIGQEIYDTKLKAKLEPEFNGQFVAIEPQSGAHYLGKTMSEAKQEASKAHPGKKFFLVRVGYKAAVSFKHRTTL